MLVLAEFIFIFLFIYPLYRHRRLHWITFFIKPESKNFLQSAISVSESIAMSIDSFSEFNRDIIKLKHDHRYSPVLHRKDKLRRKTTSNHLKNMKGRRSRGTQKQKKNPWLDAEINCQHLRLHDFRRFCICCCLPRLSQRHSVKLCKCIL